MQMRVLDHVCFQPAVKVTKVCLEIGENFHPSQFVEDSVFRPRPESPCDCIHANFYAHFCFVLQICEKSNEWLSMPVFCASSEGAWINAAIATFSKVYLRNADI